MNTLTLRSFVPNSECVVNLDADANGCVVTCRTDALTGMTVYLSWIQVNDMEYLAAVFADQQVRVFRVVVEMLGNVWQLRPE